MATKASVKAIMPSMDKKWQAESDLRTLQAAREIEASRARLSAAKRVADEQMKALSKLTKRK